MATSQPAKNSKHTFMRCECGANVHVANGGEKNLEIHRDSKEHRQAMADKSTRKISAFFSKRVAVRSAPCPPPLPGAATSMPGPSARTDHGAVADRADSRQAISSPASHSVASPTIRVLFDAAQTLPSSVPLACEDDILARFSTPPVIVPDQSPEVNWETANSIMHGELGYLRGAELLQPIIRRGVSGVEAFCKWMDSWVVHGNVPAILFQPKVDLFMDAVHLCGGSPGAIPPTSLDTVTPVAATPSFSPGGHSPIDLASDAGQSRGDMLSPNRAHSPIDLTLCTSDGEDDARTGRREPEDDRVGHQRQSTSSVTSLHRFGSRGDRSSLCYGYLVELPPGTNPGRLYPWMVDDDGCDDDVRTPSSSGQPWRTNILRGKLFLQSHTCAEQVQTVPCASCAKIGELPAVRALVARAVHGAPEHTNWKYLNMEQQSAKIQRMQTQMRKKNLYGLNTAKKLLRRTRALNSHKRLLRDVAKSDVRNISVAIRVGLRNGRGVRGMLEMVAAAQQRKYKPKDFNRADYDVARLLCCVGGNAAVTIGARALGLPSLRTIKRHARSAPLEVSAGYPTASEVTRNIDAMYPTSISETTSAPGIVGVGLMVDEISLEKRLRYDPRHNTILGLCREHSKGFNKQFNTMDDANIIWAALREQRVHLATEATVAALGALSGDGKSYTARAIHVSGSCKKETAAAHSRLLSTIYEAACTHGKLAGARIYFISTDGEAKRGAAAVPLTLAAELAPDSPIYDQLSDLPLFNILCGANGLTLDKDYKHLFKRFRTCLISERGVDILGEILTQDVLRQHLHDCGMSKDRSHALFNPNDAQDVPLACELLTEIMRLPPPPATAPPGYARKRRAMQLLGKLYSFVLKPYLTPSYTVREQLNDISTAMHMMLVFYVEGRGAFCPIQTYADYMHAGKNAMFCVAKVKVDSPDGSFYLILMGTDRLEFSFSRVRTLVPNDANADVFQCGGRLSTAAEMAEILTEHPDWDRGTSRRLHLAPLDSEGRLSRNVDHISPKNWTGDVSVRGVSVRTAWLVGRQTAIDIFQSYGYDAAALYDRLEGEGRDILHPLGRPVFKPELRGTDEILEQEEVTENGEQASAPHATADDLDPDVEDLASTALEEDGEQHYSPKIELPGGGTTYKASVVKLMTDPDACPGPASTDRMRRVRGYDRFPGSTQGASADSASTDTESDETCVVNDPAITLLRCREALFLAVVQLLSFVVNNTHLQSVGTSTLTKESTKVGFQVLKLRPVPVDMDSSIIEGEQVEEHLSIQNDWYSDAETIKFHTTNAIITTSGALIRPYSPMVDEKNAGRYFFSTDELRAGAAELLEQARSSEQLSIPQVPDVVGFPYNLNGQRCFVCDDDDGVDSSLQSLSDPLGCTLCPAEKGIMKSVPKLLEHNSAHILHDRKLRSKKRLCGFCLRDGACRFWLTTLHGKTQLDLENSVCAKKPARISYAPTLQSTTNSPCTNTPVRCPKCSVRDEAIFKYNLESHLREKHPDTPLDEHADVWGLSHEEKKGMSQVWERIVNARKKKKAKKPAVPGLVISEAHRVYPGWSVAVDAAQPQDAVPDSDDVGQNHNHAFEDSHDQLSGSGAQPSSAPVDAEDEVDITYKMVDYAPAPGTRTSTRLRAGGKRKRIEIAKICHCNEEDRTGLEHKRFDLVLCVAEGCEAEYYHRDCLSRDEQSRVPFICDSCRPIGSRAQKTRRA